MKADEVFCWIAGGLVVAAGSMCVAFLASMLLAMWGVIELVTIG